MQYIAKYNSTQPHVVIVELKQPPFNYLNGDLLDELMGTLEELDSDGNCRAIVLAAEGKAFSAGVDFTPDENGQRAAQNPTSLKNIYKQVGRLFRATKPIVAAVEGPAVGAGLGLAAAADFRVTCREARFSANFNRLGLHPGFGLCVTLPRLIGTNQTALLFYTGRRLDGEQAHRIGLADTLVDRSAVREEAIKLAAEIATSAPVAVQSTRVTLRAELAEQVQAINQREMTLQLENFETSDFLEGVAAMAERRRPEFTGQ